ncbi:MAG: RICIN domain-containing protein, partial [Chloroflexi bacterium]|nr:RICIN domain-containing protein [Chloroflexota bacterium]
MTITDVGGGYHEIRFRHSGKCLDVPGWSTSWGIQLQQYTCNGTTAQRFTVACTGCAGEIRNQNSGLCLDVEGAYTWSGAKIIQWGCHSGANQQFLVTDTYAVGLAPATGNWAQNIPPCPENPDPACHHLVTCEPVAFGDYYQYISSGNCIAGGGDWSTDYYATEGSLIKFQGIGIGTAGANVTAQVWAITQTCSQVSRSKGGSTVFVNVYTNGFWEGWYAYAHLDNVVVQPEQWISSGTALGETKWWTDAGGCYQVGSSSGVHTHIEMFNRDDPNYSPDG